ncbi:MAG TPA: hypothetical protein VHH36_09130, partial [Candidatus Thermoplasmatota archaeon]|nr:hypothetical protein [Candidatus Thermoplasmatota archaeon]
MPRISRALAAAALAALVASPLASAGTWFLFETTNATANESHFMRQFDNPSAAVGDFDGDGRKEIVQQND